VVANDYGTLFTWLAAAMALFAYEAIYQGGFASAAPRPLLAGGLIVVGGALALAIRHLKKSGRLRLARG
jgi:hypothetical protein